ncbi:MAG TPA: polyphosphate kinase 2 family protein [Chryseosolibacter sp.]|nr:polyphosphate kinase 2 family protein [Chryseosolibacter sp.]
MVSEEMYVHINKLRVKPGKKISLSDYDTGYKGKEVTKAQAEELLEETRKHLAEIQDQLYAHNRYGALIIFQALDAAGKDGAVKHIMSGMNPMGVKVHSFKAPTATELDHDYFWRHYSVLPGRGEIAIHNRSHYENVLVTRVHPEYLLKEQIPGIVSVKDINKKFWAKRYKQINRLEKNLVQNGTIILKFFLHLSKKEQKKRLLERIDDPTKNWKFDMNDLRERGFWDDYQKYYAEVISATSTKHAPWFIIPADDKWYSRLAIASVIYRQLLELKLHYPVVNDQKLADIATAREQLLSEGNGQAVNPVDVKVKPGKKIKKETGK